MTQSETRFNRIVTGTPERGAVLISHGAGGTSAAPLLVQTSHRLANAGFLTVRWNFGYVAKRSAPSAGGKREIPEMVEMIEDLQNVANGKPIILLGKSFGGRVSSYVGANRTDISGYVFYGLPLQGMSKTAKPRDWSHLSKLGGRALFVTGEKDKLCDLKQLAEAQKFLSIPYDSEVVPGDHSYKPGGEKIALERCIAWFERNF